MIQTGVYQHYKGGLYVVRHVAKHTETGETLVVYHDSEGRCYARPEKVFSEMVDPKPPRHAPASTKVPRFTLLVPVIHGSLSAREIIEQTTTKEFQKEFQ